MIFLLKTLIFVNLVLIFLFIIEKFFIFNKNNIMPKLKAKWGLATAVILFIYISLIIFTGMLGIIIVNLQFAGLFIFAIIPFIIGHLTQYKTLKIYSNIQILMFILSLGFCIYYLSFLN